MAPQDNTTKPNQIHNSTSFYLSLIVSSSTSVLKDKAASRCQSKGRLLIEHRGGWQRSIPRGSKRGISRGRQGQNRNQPWREIDLCPASNAWQRGGRQRRSRNQISVRKGEKGPIFCLPSLAAPLPSLFLPSLQQPSIRSTKGVFVSFHVFAILLHLGDGDEDDMRRCGVPKELLALHLKKAQKQRHLNLFFPRLILLFQQSFASLSACHDTAMIFSMKSPHRSQSPQKQ